MRAAQKYDPELVKDALRPVVFEEVRVDVDDEMRVLLTNLKEMVAAEKAAKSGKKGKKGKKGTRRITVQHIRVLERHATGVLSHSYRSAWPADWLTRCP
jgi:hypothetical protein